MRRDVWSPLPIGIVLLAIPLTAHGGPAALEVAGGVLLSFDSSHRDAFGGARSLGVGLCPRLGDRDSWLILDASINQASGQALPSTDTFDIGDATYTVVPVNLGVRANISSTSNPPTEPVRLYFGGGATIAWTRWEPSPELGLSMEEELTFGGFLEIRPELVMGERWRAFGRARVTLLLDVRYELIDDVNYSGALFQLGLARVFG